MSEVLIERESRIAVLTLNRPQRCNAITNAMVGELVAALAQCAVDPACRAVVITGSGTDFCSGGDLDSLSGDATPLMRKELLDLGIHRLPRFLVSFYKPLLAAINGAAVGAGLDIALMADLRLVSEGARLSTGYVRAGLVPGDGGAWLLPRLVGQQCALELLWTGRFVSAAEAVELGIALRSIPADDLLAQTIELADQIARQSPLAVQATKRLVVQGSRIDFEAALDMAASHMAVIQSTDDSHEALAALRERRSPRFTGR